MGGQPKDGRSEGMVIMGYIDEEKLHREQADKAAKEISMEYAQGGIVRPATTTFTNDTGAPIPIMLNRGCVVMSSASLRALSPDMLVKLTKGSDIITAEEALAELDDEYDEDAHFEPWDEDT